MIQLELPGMITNPAEYFRQVYLCDVSSDKFKCDTTPKFIQSNADYSALEARVYASMVKDGRLSNYLDLYHSKPAPEQLELPLTHCGGQS